MEFSAKQIATLLSGSIEGNADVSVSDVAKIEEGRKGSLSFLANPKYTPYIYETESSVVIVNRDFVAEKPVKATLIRVDDAYSSFAKLLELYQQFKNDKKGISSLAFIATSAQMGQELYVGEFAFVGEKTKISDKVKIYPQVYIGDQCVVGEGCVLYPGVKLYAGTIVGKNCIIHAGCVIGSDGFGFAPQQDKTYKKIPQTGNVIIEDDVELGANTTIDRATLGATIVRKGVKLDNLIQVAHNVEIGENTVIAALTGISGSAKIGAGCMIGGQVGVAGHISIADEVKIGAQAGVGSKVRETGQVIIGTPAIPILDFKRASVHFKNLDSIVKNLRELEAKVNQLIAEKGNAEE